MLTIIQLAESADVSPRTIRYYQQRGLLRAPGRMGRGPHYSTADIHRLRLIRQLQQGHVPLAEIRQRLRGMSGEEIEARLKQEPTGGIARPAQSARAERRVFGLARATWERIELAPDVELHVRRPLTLAQNRFIERLVEEAQKFAG